jgi:hypothetical protein
MQTEPAQSVSLNADVEPAVPVAVGGDATGESPTDLVLVERHPVDATVT